MESISSRLLTQLPQSSFENFNTLNMFTGANWAESLKSINHFSAEIQKSALAYKNLVPQFQNSAFLEQMQKMAADYRSMTEKCRPMLDAFAKHGDVSESLKNAVAKINEAQKPGGSSTK